MRPIPMKHFRLIIGILHDHQAFSHLGMKVQMQSNCAWELYELNCEVGCIAYIKLRIIPIDCNIHAGDHDELARHYHQSSQQILALFGGSYQIFLHVLLHVAHDSQCDEVFSKFNMVFFDHFMSHFKIVIISLLVNY